MGRAPSDGPAEGRAAAGTRIGRRSRGLAKLSTLLALALTILSACGEGASEPRSSASEPRNGSEQAAGAPIDYKLLLRRLEQEGLRVEPLGRARVDFLQDSAYLVKVGGEEVRVFEFENADVAAGAAQRVSPDGYAYTTSTGGASVSWVAPPHFFRSGRMIVLYLGQRKSILQPLSEMLGREFAGAATDP